jgi:hypothetical protein
VLLVCTVYSVLYSEVALSRKPFGIEHMYIYTLLLRMTDPVISQNIYLSSWDTLYISYIRPYTVLFITSWFYCDTWVNGEQDKSC